MKGKGRAGKGEEGKKEGLRQFPANIVRGPSWARGRRGLEVGGVLEGRGRSGWPGAQRAGGWLPERSAESGSSSRQLGPRKEQERADDPVGRTFPGPALCTPLCARSCAASTEMFITDLAGGVGSGTRAQSRHWHI